MDTNYEIHCLKMLCAAHGRYTVAAVIGTSPDYLYQITEEKSKLPSGKPRGPGRKIKDALDQHFPGWRALGMSRSQGIPLISWVQAVHYDAIVNNADTYPPETRVIQTSVEVRKHTFALVVESDSMEPEFPVGHVLIVEPELTASPGDFVVAHTDDSDELVFRQLVKDGADRYLKPLNPRYPIKPLGDAKIVAVVRSVEKIYR